MLNAYKTCNLNKIDNSLNIAPETDDIHEMLPQGRVTSTGGAANCNSIVNLV